MNSNGFGVTVVLVVLAIFVIVVLLRSVLSCPKHVLALLNASASTTAP